MTVLMGTIRTVQGSTMYRTTPMSLYMNAIQQRSNSNGRKTLDSSTCISRAVLDFDNDYQKFNVSA